MKSYITTPLYYVNDAPHMGSAYTTLCADVLHRYHKLLGWESLFLTGVDEHGQKVQKAALSNKLDPQEHCDQMAKVFKQTWQELGIEYDVFFRTSHPQHKKVVQTILQQLFAKELIYESTYEGWYCMADEIFYKQSELKNGLSPTGRPVEKIIEKNYFFKMSTFRERLLQHYQTHPTSVEPISKRNELIGFLQNPLEDLCISRPKTRLTWGIELPFDKNYVTYVWFDALLNYASATGLAYDANLLEKWWVTAQVKQLLGKDILITHGVYWPSMLMALGLKLPDTLLVHGWLLNKDKAKMSKSTGSVMSCTDMCQMLGGPDPLRYYLICCGPWKEDTPISQELVLQFINAELANKLGNLLSRTLKLMQKHLTPKDAASDAARGIDTRSIEAMELKKQCLALKDTVPLNVKAHRLSQITTDISNITKLANLYLEKYAPWKLLKNDSSKQEGLQVLCTACDTLRVLGVALWPIMPAKSQELLSCLGVTVSTQNAHSMWQEHLAAWGQKNWQVQTPKKALFPRI